MTTQDPSIRETQIELNVQQTIAAQQATNQVRITSTQNPDILSETQSAQQTLSAQATEAALNAPQLEGTTPTIQPESSATPEDTKTQVTDTSGDFNDWIRTANILLYEDIISDANTNRYIKDSLTEMGIDCQQGSESHCKDDGSAKGWLQTDLEGNAPNGNPWDLIIVAAEYKTGAPESDTSLPGEFFTSLLNWVDNGTPVILEFGNFDEVYASSAKGILDRCGIEYESNWVKVPVSRMAMFPENATNPILTQPNSNLTFTDVTDHWTTKSKTFYYDLGDLVRLSPNSNATILVGTVPDLSTSHGTLTVCMDGRLLIQTFSSHQLTFNSMRLVWENYIYNMLKVRFQLAP
jgi:hypothetical protein